MLIIFSKEHEAKRFGFVEVLDKSEWVLDTDDHNLSLKQLTEIAEKNNIKVLINSSEDELLSLLEKEIPKMTEIAEQKGPTATDLVTKIIREAEEISIKDKTPFPEDKYFLRIMIMDDICEYGQAKKLLEIVMESCGIRKTTKTIKTDGFKILTDNGFTLTKNCDDMQKANDTLAEAMKLSPEQSLVAMRYFYKKSDFEFPTTIKKKIGSLKDRVFAWLVSNVDATKTEFDKYLLDEGGKNSEEAAKYHTYFDFAHAFHNAKLETEPEAKAA